MIVAGFGFRAGAGADSLRDAFARAGGQADRMATLADKAAAPAFRAVAATHDVVAVAPHAARAVATPTQSAAVQAARATGSVAEACALAAAGPGARLLAPRAISGDRMASCALAQSAPTAGTPS